MYPTNLNIRAQGASSKGPWGGLLKSHVSDDDPDCLPPIGAAAATGKMDALPEGAQKTGRMDGDVTSNARRKRDKLMRKAGLYRALGEHASLLSSGAAALATLLLAGGYLAVGGWMGVQELKARHQSVLDAVPLLMQDATHMLDEALESQQLAQIGPGTPRPLCSSPAVELLRAMRVGTQHQRLVFITDDLGRVVCTSSGAVHEAQPMPGGTQVQIFGKTHMFWREAATQGPSTKPPMVTISRAGVGTSHLAGVYRAAMSEATAIWLDKKGGGVALLASQPDASPKMMDRLLAAASTGEGRAFWSFGLNAESGFVFSSRVGNSGMTVQSAASWIDMLNVNRYWAAAWFILSALLGVVLKALSHRVFREYLSMNSRVDFLLMDENITCVYQPIVNIQSGKVIGCEVLVRFKDGANHLNQAEVIEASLSRKLDWRLDKLIIRKAWGELFAHLGRTRAGMSPAISYVAFNVFPQNISVAKIAPLFSNLRSTIGELPFDFSLEIIEHSYKPETIHEIKLLRDQGFSFSIDDFGTGYSNLNSIKNLSPTTIKIDRCFVNDVLNHNLRASLIPEIVSIANAVQAKVIAEGIESKEQASELFKLGITIGQGYYYAKPMTIDRFVNFVREHNATGYQNVALVAGS